MSAGDKGKSPAEETKDVAPASASATTSSGEQTIEQKVNTITDRLAQISMLRKLFGQPEVKPIEEFKFWKTQPVVKPGQNGNHGPIEADKHIDDIAKEPETLSEGLEWTELDITTDAECKEVYELLCENYVEDSDAQFRFDYKAEFLKWALMPPGWKKQWHIGIRDSATKNLVCFISGIPSSIKTGKKVQDLVEINFLCVHKTLRSRRLAPVLIKEITRRVNLEGIFQALYTGGSYLPTPFTTCRYYHRSLNFKKLVDVGFSYVPKNTTMTRQLRLLKLEDKTTLNMRPMEEKDVPRVTMLLNEYNKKSYITQIFTEEEVKYWLMPIDGVVCSYVAIEKQKVTDFVSYYILPSSIIGGTKHTHINAAYLFYYFPKGQGTLQDRIPTLMNDALSLAKKDKADVFNCLEMGENSSFLEKLHFGKGDGNLHYYLYNYRLDEVDNKKVNLVLL